VLWLALIPVALTVGQVIDALFDGTLVIVAESAERYGLIGVAFAFVSWLVTSERGPAMSLRRRRWVR